MDRENEQLTALTALFSDFLRINQADRQQNNTIFYGVVAVVTLVMALVGFLGYRFFLISQKPPEIPIVQKIDTGESRLALEETNKRLSALTGNLMLTAGNIEDIKAILQKIEAKKQETRVEIRTIYVEREKKRKKAKAKPKPVEAETVWLPQSEVDKLNRHAAAQAKPKKPVIDMVGGEAVLK
jgi:hypothetical protein